MSIATTQTTAVTTPSSKRLQRLAVAAGTYLGKDAGDTIPVEEVRLQAEANGYKEQEITAMLESEGFATAQKICIPNRGELFGELWADTPAGVPSPNAPADATPDIVDTFRDWLQKKVDKGATNHAYSRRNANRVFARGKDVDRHFVREYDTFSTVLISYCAEVLEDESITEHAKKFYPRAVVRKRRRLLKRLGVYEESAGVSLRAPKTGHRVPFPDTPKGYTHAHDFLWIPAEVSAKEFYPLVEKHVEKVEGATEEAHPLNEAAKVQVHTSVEVETPHSVQGRGSSMDTHRGSTTSLPQELGNNLPLLHTKLDARGLPAYAEEWCANLRLGADGKISTKGIARYQPLYRFGEVADSMRWMHKYMKGVEQAESLVSALDNNKRIYKG